VFDLICPGTILSFTVIYLFSESDEDSETVIPSLAEVMYIPISNMLNSLLNSSVGKNLKDEDDLYSIIAGIFGAVLLFNIQGMIPYTHTITSSLTNTLFISLGIFIFIIANMIHQQGINHLLNLFMPQGCPIALVPLLIPIELISYCFRVVSLSVRLFANMMAGHTLLKVIVGFS
jgi:F-type H+-transporting ATPase subunit a